MNVVVRSSQFHGRSIGTESFPKTLGLHIRSAWHSWFHPSWAEQTNLASKRRVAS